MEKVLTAMKDGTEVPKWGDKKLDNLTTKIVERIPRLTPITSILNVKTIAIIMKTSDDKLHYVLCGKDNFLCTRPCEKGEMIPETGHFNVTSVDGGQKFILEARSYATFVDVTRRYLHINESKESNATVFRMAKDKLVIYDGNTELPLCLDDENWVRRKSPYFGSARPCTTHVYSVANTCIFRSA